MKLVLPESVSLRFRYWFSKPRLQAGSSPTDACANHENQFACMLFREKLQGTWDPQWIKHWRHPCETFYWSDWNMKPPLECQQLLGSDMLAWVAGNSNSSAERRKRHSHTLNMKVKWTPWGTPKALRYTFWTFWYISTHFKTKVFKMCWNI